MVEVVSACFEYGWRKSGLKSFEDKVVGEQKVQGLRLRGIAANCRTRLVSELSLFSVPR